MDLTLEASTEASQTVIVVTGSVDLESRDRLVTAAAEALAAGPTSLALDLAGVSFIDSTGIGAIVEISRDAEDRGTDFALRNPSNRVRRILEITGLQQAWALDQG